jgi:hypothetical protein
MAKQIRSVDFLPEIFQTPINEQFLSATLDQLIQNPQFTQTQGFIGRTIGPGVNANDRYVIEPTKTRTDYQLEPGVVQVNPEDSQRVVDAITYPGINDALQLQGAYVNNADRMYTSDYYTWDPFVDFDKFVNYAQYYWLPGGPLAVDVSSTTVPLTDNFAVTRQNGVYTFTGLAGTNPDITLVRGGSYTFQVAQNQSETVNFRVTNNDANSWNVDFQPNPALTLIRGNTYVFNLSQTAPWQFYFKTEASLGNVNIYNPTLPNGNLAIQNNGNSSGLITFTVPQDAPDTLFYCNDVQFNLRGQINVVNGTPGTGPGFWIQAEPGVNGRVPATPNISSREVLGVVNNGEDLGTVTFNVPLTTAQDFYFNMPSIGLVDLVTDLDFNDINNVYVDDFFASYPTGIDGITNLQGRTLVFISQESTPSPANLYSVWRIQYLVDGGGTYLSLQFVDSVSLENKFTIGFGSQYSSTSWYKNNDGYFSQIPLLTADKDVLYYQDGTDPEIVGRIRLVDETGPSIVIADILGSPTYTSPNGVIFSNGMKVVFRGNVVPVSYQNNEYYVEGVGTAITLLLVNNYVTPETYTVSASVPYDSTPFDFGNFDESLNQPLIPDYLTINRASPDLNAWTRSNRWFHIDVINASAEYNNTTPVLDNNFRAKRPILEFRAGTRLFESGTQALQPVNIVDFTITDALSQVNGSTGYSSDGFNLINGSRIIFAADTDPAVRKTVYSVEFVDPDTVAPLIDQPVIVLTPVATALVDQTVVCLDGLISQGFTYYYDGVEWLEAQLKISVNQPPLFDLYDNNDISFGNKEVYPSSNFTGSPLFSYAIGNAAPDLVLGFPLTYLSLTNIGDIVFDNNFYKDSFIYTVGNTGKTVPLSSGYVKEYQDRTTYVREIGWQTAVTTSLVRQQFRFVYDGSPLLLDVAVNENMTVPAVQIWTNGKFVESNYYTYVVGTNTTTITMTSSYVPGDVIEVSVISDQVSATGFYQVPMNLSNNPLNGNSQQFTLGTIRNHYSSIAQNLLQLSGPVIGANNTRDLGNIVPYGLQILQQSSPLTLTGYFLREPNYDIFASIAYNSTEYVKFKSQLLNAVTTFGIEEYGNWTAAELLDRCIAQITAGRTNLNPFYWSDMIPTGSVFTSNSYTVNPITTNRFNTIQTYDFTTSNYLGLCVYVNNVLLTRGYDYEVSTEGPTLTIVSPLNIGDVVVINEYSHTYGNFVPSTPTKLGLYPKYEPKIFLDPDYVNPTPVIQGHDGSITVAFGDIRDQVLLEFETRIFSNLKNDDNPPPLVAEDVIPGYFRSTDYTQQEINTILGESFLTWAGANKLDYGQQAYVAGNEFTYNYSQAGNRIDNQPLLGAWRGIYRWFYDTLSPNLTPWEMLGFSEQPDWWENRYGPAPYTADNLVLWGDLESGLVADPVAPYVIPKYRRPGLTSVIPVDSQGELLPPFYSVMGAYNPQGFVKSWQVGDGGPVEASWWISSSYPFAVMRLLALTRPAQFFSLFADRDLYRYNLEFDQFLYNNRYRIQPDDIQVYGNGVSKASYINWIVDYNQQFALNSTDSLTTDMANLDVRLCYRFASFLAAPNLQLYLEKSAPQSQNDSLLIPPESYNLLLYKNQPFNRISYSAVIVEVVEGGFSVYGYNNADPYFSIQTSRVSGPTQTISAGGFSVTVPAQYSNQITQIPYGYTFTNRASVVDFLLGYGQYLDNQGLSFVVQENGYTLNWGQMAQEFLYFANQGWTDGTILNLNPSATQILTLKPGAVVDSIVTYTPENLLLDQNRRELNARNLVVYRQGNIFKINPDPAGNQTVSFLNLQFTDYENMVVLNNETIFNDLVFDTVTAERQSRLKLQAVTSTEWNGTLNAQGFILNENNVKAWQPNVKYTKGDIVIYKNNFWQATTIVQPKQQFEFNDWYKSNYDRIEQGMLQNLATKADQLTNSYNTQTANLNKDNDLLAYGLIGFRPRQYMSDLNLTDTTQVKLYQEFIKTTGSKRATNLFTQGNFDKLTAQYKIYETWGIQVGTYGAQANRSWFEVALDEAQINGNPGTFQIIEPNQTTEADQAILLQNLWAESYAIPNTDILPLTYDRNPETALPTAGYVNLNDADITVFNLNDPSNISANLDTIGNGTTIWVAQDNSYDWNIYQCQQIPGRLIQVTDNLNGTARATFSSTVNLSVGDLIIVRYFSNSVDGVYRVISVPNINSVVIAYSFVNSNQTTLTGIGLAFYLQTMRVAQASDIINLPYANQLVPGATAYVDDIGNGHWAVLQKTDPFQPIAAIESTDPDPNSRFGYATAQSSNHYAMIVGAPDTDSGAGAVYTYRITSQNQYVQNTKLSLTATDTAGYGESLDFGDRTWAVAGASQSNFGAGYAAMLYLIPASSDYVQTQLLVAPDQDFSSSVAFGSATKLSANERWLYVSAPGANEVYAYNKIDVPLQGVTYVADGTTTTFNYSNHVMIDYNNHEQLLVTVNNTIQTFGVDYNLSATSVQFSSAPVAPNQIKIQRRTIKQLDSTTYFGVTQNSTTATGSGATFTVTNTRGDYEVSITAPGTGYIVGEQLTISYTQVDPAGSVANNMTITVNAVVSGGITEFTVTGNGVSNATTFDLSESLYTATNIYAVTITVNGVLQRPFIDYNLTGTILTFVTLPSAGAVILADSATQGAYWQYVATLEIPGLDVNAELGTSISTDSLGRQILLGAPYASADDAEGDPIINAGAVFAFDRSTIKYIVSNAAQKTYAIPLPYITPISVLLNNQYLTNTDQFINGQFTVSGNNIVLSTAITLNVGDVIEIETNQFQQIQKFASNVVIDDSKFGQSIDICSNACSIYVGAPWDTYSTGVIQSGMVQRQVNQARTYGIITSTVANPGLTSGDTIRINLQPVSVPNSPNNTVAGLVGAINSSGIPNITAVASSDVILTGDGSTKIFDIDTVYSSASAYTTVVYVDDTLLTQGVNYTYDNTTQQLNFVTAPAQNSSILVVSGRITIHVTNSLAAQEFNKLTILPGITGTAFNDLGFVTYAYAQTIVSPNPTDFAYFGTSLSVNTGAVNLVVGSPNGDVYEPTTFDNNNTYFDDRSTTVFGYVTNSGIVYTYDFLPSTNNSLANPGRFVFGQQIYVENLASGDQFGQAVNYRSGRLIVGAPGADLGDSTLNYGSIFALDNAQDAAVWNPIYTQQPAVDVNLLNSVYSFDKVLGGTQTYFDFIDPLQGKILGVARRNIDFIGAVDPASYNTGTVHNIGTSWGAEHLGEIWWDTNTVRFIDANQDNLTYASRRWGQVFPGSTIDIYQWTSSSVTPANYAGPGIPLSTSSFTVRNDINDQGIIVTTYYFWVRGIATTATRYGKTLSPTAISAYINNPVGSGLPYIAALSANAIALYNATDLLSANDTILHVEYDRQATGGGNAIHTEYEFIAEGKADAFLNPNLYRKLLDSFCGVTTTGALVPDPLLSPGMQYGLQFRPRQSMFINRFMALQNYLSHVNNILVQYPITETRTFNLLNSAEPIPVANSGAWDFEVANLTVLSFQNLQVVPVGYLYLVDSDSNQGGRWTIYEVTAGSAPGERYLSLIRVQNYDTRLYWNYIDWYLPGYNSSVQPVASVANKAGLQTLSLQTAPLGTSVRVVNNGQGKFEVYRRDGIDSIAGWTRVGLQDGTIEFSEVLWNYPAGGFGFDTEVFDAQYFDQEPVIETRQIIRAINEELFTGDLLIFRNESLILMFKYIYSEFTTPSWLVKTSYIEVDHVVRGLLPYEQYQPDNQTFVIDYLTEVKPYHVQTLNFNLIYEGLDLYDGSLTDYDLPAYWKTGPGLPQFVSPILLPYTYSNSVTQSFVSDAELNAEIWLTWPYSQWFNNYGLSLEQVNVYDITTVYAEIPEITVGQKWLAETAYVVGDQIFHGTNLYTVIQSGTTGVSAPTFTAGSLQDGTTILLYSGTAAKAQARLNANGTMAEVVVVVPGSGYLANPVLAINDVYPNFETTGVKLIPVMGNNLVRDFSTTIKYDRYQYQSTIEEWQPNVVYTQGERVRWNNVVWSSNLTQSTATFVVENWTRVNAGDLSGVDRTMGFYTPTVNMPGLSLPLLIDGVEYPGVKVQAPGFNQNTGFDVGNYDINPFDNISYGPEGRPTYSPTILDARYSSSYLDTFLGTRPTDINVDGGGYVDVYSSYAPEELVPGISFDTLDLRVFTTPGTDWSGGGHGFPIANLRYVFNSANPTTSFAGILDIPFTLQVFNATTGVQLEPSSIDWANYEFTISATDGDTINIYVTGVGGGNQLYINTYLGDEIGNTVVVPFAYNDIYDFLIYNGQQQLTAGVDYTWEQETNISTRINFTNTYVGSDRINLCAFGYTDEPQYLGWSLPVFQTETSDGSLSIPLTDSLQGTNPANMLVTSNGVMLQPSEGIEHMVDGSTTVFLLPNNGGYSQGLIVDNDVFVYVDNVLMIQNVDYVVDAWDGSTARTVTFFTAPMPGSMVLISVRTEAEFWVVDDELQFQPANGYTPTPGDEIVITTWNNTSEQQILTQVFVGEGEQPNNLYDTGREISDPNRVLVNVDGDWVFAGLGFTVVDNTKVQIGLPVTPSSVVVIYSFTQTVVPGSMAFRIFQDMRGIQLTYRITADTTTTLTAPVSITDDVIHVANAGALPEPNFANNNNLWGVITIGPERILYRNRDTTANTVSGLLRGTAGTAITTHAQGNLVYNMGPGNLLPMQYQDYIDKNDFMGDNSTTEFVTDIVVDNRPLVYIGGTITVTVGGTIQPASAYTVTQLEPVAVTLNTIPSFNTEVQITITYLDLTSITETFTATGFTQTFVTVYNVGLVEQASNTYVLDNFNPVVITFDTAPPSQHVVYIRNQRGAEDEFDFSFANGVQTTFSTDIDLTIPVRVYVGGIEQDPDTYQVTSLDPIIVLFDNPPPSSEEVTILVRLGVTWYAPGVGTPSNGVPLQDTDTRAARFLRGLT